MSRGGSLDDASRVAYTMLAYFAAGEPCGWLGLHDIFPVMKPTDASAPCCRQAMKLTPVQVSPYFFHVVQTSIFGSVRRAATW